jgi:hypothetical protein
MAWKPVNPLWSVWKMIGDRSAHSSCLIASANACSADRHFEVENAFRDRGAAKRWKRGNPVQVGADAAACRGAQVGGQRVAEAEKLFTGFHEAVINDLGIAEKNYRCKSYTPAGQRQVPIRQHFIGRPLSGQPSRWP